MRETYLHIMATLLCACQFLSVLILLQSLGKQTNRIVVLMMPYQLLQQQKQH